MEGWEPIRSGVSGAEVRRSVDGTTYVKTASGALYDELVAEYERLQWLSTTDLPVARILDWEDDGSAATLTTSAVPGVPMSELAPSAANGAVKGLGNFLKRLHAVDRDGCPFERWLAVTVPLARVNVDEGRVDEDAFDEERTGRTAAALLQELLDGRPDAERLEQGDLVLCHGDACLPNFLVDPDTLEVSGMVDVGRLGVADRHLDLALAHRSMSDTSLNPAYGPAAAEALLSAYGLPADPWRLDFYRLLDELF